MLKDFHINFIGVARNPREKFIRGKITSLSFATEKAAHKKIRQLYPELKHRLKVIHDPINKEI